MASETIVAVFDTLSHAEAAVSDLVAAGVPSNAIRQHAGTAGSDLTATPGTAATPATTTTDTTTHRGGFWAWLTGETEANTEHHALYDASLERGSTVVTVIAADTTQADVAYRVLDQHNPVDLEERHAEYSSSGIYPAASTGYADTATGVGTIGGATAGTAATGISAGEEVIPLAEESLQVGKREVDRGTTRVRRYVVERPVEEQVRLRDESVSVFRRPVSGSATVAPDAFTDREIVVNETGEEAVVAKTARVVEEVVVQKDVGERVETVRDTLRREEADIKGPHGTPGVTRP